MHRSSEQIQVLEIAITRFHIHISTTHVIISNMNCQKIICLEWQQQMGMFFFLQFCFCLTMHEYTIKDKGSEANQCTGKHWRPLASIQTSPVGAEQLLAGKDYNQNSRCISFSFGYGHICQSSAYHIKRFRRDLDDTFCSCSVWAQFSYSQALMYVISTMVVTEGSNQMSFSRFELIHLW